MMQRQRIAEVMDDPKLDAARHQQALAGLARLNKVCGSARVVFRAITSESAPQKPPRPLRILDLACGGGDVAVGLWRLATQAGLAVEIQGCDISERAVAWARQRADRAGAKVHFFTLDVIHDPLPGDFDVIYNTLFLHHLSRDDATQVLRKMGAASKRVIIDDLRRTRLGWFLAWAGGRIFSRSSVVHIDGPRSVRAAFSEDELLELANHAGLIGPTVQRHWPQRMLLRWDRGGGERVL